MTSTTVGELVERLRATWPTDPGFGPVTTAHRALIHDAADKLSSLQKEIDAYRAALDLARKEIVELSCDAAVRLRENGYDCDPPERTYLPILDRIDALSNTGGHNG